MSTYNEMVGNRLRSIRRQRGLSLQDVQKLSDQEFKAAVLGAYERGERSLSLPRLQRLAQFFSVPIVQLLPQEETPTPTAPTEGVTIDLNQIERLSGARWSGRRKVPAGDTDASPGFQRSCLDDPCQ